MSFQAVMMGEVGPAVYPQLRGRRRGGGKLETYAQNRACTRPSAVPIRIHVSAQPPLRHLRRAALALATAAAFVSEGPSRRGGYDDSKRDSSDYPSELGSEDAETLSVHSEAQSDGTGHRIRLGGAAISGMLAGGTHSQVAFASPAAAGGLPSAVASGLPSAVGINASAAASGASLASPGPPERVAAWAVRASRWAKLS